MFAYGKPDDVLQVVDPPGTQAIFADVRITRSQQPARPAPLVPMQASVDGLAFLGHDGVIRQTRSGDSLRWISYWRYDGPAALNADVRLELRGPVSHTQAIGWTAEVPTHELLSGDVLRAPVLLRVPAGLPRGRYALWLRLGDGAMQLGQLEIDAPEHTFVEPMMAVQQHTLFGTVAELAAYGVDTPRVRAGDELRLRLAWRAAAEMSASYKVFVHVLDAAGNRVASADAVPAGWLRPTTGWVPGEYVLDTHVLPLPKTLPAGRYLIRIGLYDEATGERLRHAGGDSLQLALPVEVGP